MEINENQLEDVAGGTGDRDCWFMPQKPYQYKRMYGTVAIKCESKCFNPYACRCHDTVFCEDKWHLMEQDPYELLRWFATPRNLYNHDFPGKVCQPLK